MTALAAIVILIAPDLRKWRPRHPDPKPGGERVAAAIYAELNAGRSLRHAIAVAGSGQTELTQVRRLAAAGAPMAMVVDALRPDERLGAAIDVAARSGGHAAAVFHRLADRAAADADLVRQQRVLTTQARLLAAIVVGIPVAWMVFGGFARIVLLFAQGAGIVAIAGLVMEIAGATLVWRLASS